jgi:stage II sporulation protein D
MQIRVGLKTGNLVGLDHKELVISSTGGILIKAASEAASHTLQLPPGARVSLSAHDSSVIITQSGGKKTSFGHEIEVHERSAQNPINLESKPTESSPSKPASNYHGTLFVTANGSDLRAILQTDLESYVQGVLQSEVPSYFNLEAMKAQAVLARTYGLHPRLSHAVDHFNVCDSYLHCQAFYGIKSLNPMQQQAISSTKGRILTYGGKPALAVFSACAGGHTESYEFAFSDPETDAFPSPPIPYLKGVPEGKLPKDYPSEAGLRELYREPAPQTDDAWSPHNFRWQVQLKADAMEAHMHHIISELQKDPQFKPFIQPPKSDQFGHIKSFEITKRGVAGTGVSMTIHTSTGDWVVRKELTIRSVFQNPDVNLKRLKSARVFFNHSQDSLGLLSGITIYGFGSGHGVGLQQIGAQGLASKGLSYEQIIEHYYRGAAITALNA